MPIWKNTDSGWKTVPLMYDCLNQDVFFCGGGPSLKSVDPHKIKQSGVFVAGVNNVYPYIKPDIWFAMDDPECYSKQVFWEPFIKVMRGGYQNRLCEGREISKNYNLFYADAKKFSNQEDLFSVKNKDINFIWKKNTMALALHVLYWMGAKKIYLVGCDLSNKNGDYHHGQVLSKKNKKWNTNCYNGIVKWLKWFNETAKKYDVELISCTKDSPINDFLRYVELDDALELAKKDIPWGGKLTHVSDLKK